jgi:hypothetical protein
MQTSQVECRTGRADGRPSLAEGWEEIISIVDNGNASRRNGTKILLYGRTVW